MEFRMDYSSQLGVDTLMRKVWIWSNLGMYLKEIISQGINWELGLVSDIAYLRKAISIGV